jgi:hypothetical protein
MAAGFAAVCAVMVSPVDLVVGLAGSLAQNGRL